jgi:hypothetical protein
MYNVVIEPMYDEADMSPTKKPTLSHRLSLVAGTEEISSFLIGIIWNCGQKFSFLQKITKQ